MSDHERGPEEDEEKTTPAAKRPKFDQTESRGCVTYELRISQHMREIYHKLSGQNFTGTLV